MKTFWLVLISIILGIATGLATATWRVGTVDEAYRPGAPDRQAPCCAAHAEAVPRAQVDQREFEFGTMDAHAERQHAFTIKNVGRAPLELTAGDTSCSCTMSELKQNTLGPGESTAVVITWHANERFGPYRQTAVIHTNDPEQPRIELVVAGEIVQSLRAIPSSLHFGRMAADEPAEAEVTLLCLVDEPFEIVGYELSNEELAPFFEVSHESIPVDEHEHPEAHAAARVRVRVKSGLPPGAFRQTINLRTSLPDVQEFPLEVEGNVSGDISIMGIGPGWDGDRNLLDIGNVPAGQGASRKLLLVARGEHRDQVAFRVERRTPEWLEVTIGEPRLLASGVVSQTPLTITIPKDSPPVAYLGSEQGKLGEVRLSTNHPTTPQLRIRLRLAVIGGG